MTARGTAAPGVIDFLTHVCQGAGMAADATTDEPRLHPWEYWPSTSPSRPGAWVFLPDIEKVIGRVYEDDKGRWHGIGAGVHVDGAARLEVAAELFFAWALCRVDVSLEPLLVTLGAAPPAPSRGESAHRVWIDDMPVELRGDPF
jgi:hypothetical protein